MIDAATFAMVLVMIADMLFATIAEALILALVYIALVRGPVVHKKYFKSIAAAVKMQALMRGHHARIIRRRVIRGIVRYLW